MISRGEVALIVANKGAALGLMSSVFFGPTIIIVIVTTIITPILLKIAFARATPAEARNADSSLVKSFNESEKLEMIDQRISEAGGDVECTCNPGEDKPSAGDRA
jgi:hypothetical protein